MRTGANISFGMMALGGLALAGCSQKPAETPPTTTATTTTTTTTDAPAATPATPAAAPAATASAAPAADNTDTVSGAKLASFTGDATAGAIVFVQCKTCHDPKLNKIGPHLDGVVGRKAGSVADFSYSAANKNSGITWTPDKLFQYLEKPQRVVPGTKMAFAGIPDPQKRANVIAYLGTLK